MADTTAPSVAGTAAPSTDRAPRPNDEEKTLPTLATELYQLVVGYLKQETLDPMKSLGRFIGLGVAGAVVFGTGAIVLLLAGLPRCRPRRDPDSRATGRGRLTRSRWLAA